MSAQNPEILRHILDAWARGDYATGLDSIDPEIEVIVALEGDADGTYRGHAGLTRMLSTFWTEFEDPRSQIEETFPAGSDVVAGVRFQGRGKQSGVDIDMAVWHVWRFRDGKAVRWHVLRTKQEALEVAAPAE